ncbi:MAG: ABC transporter substrate-binding protein [candidate division WOR-3 bacterium]|nr:ABC transporter substrate-binding protein [candidate division WOR-3 bacterium]
MTRVIVFLLVVTVAAPATVPELTVAYRRNDHAAPLYAACLYPKDFRARYGLYLKENKPRGLYDLFSGPRSTLSLRLAPFDSDSAVLTALLSGGAQVGILASEEILTAVLADKPVRILAPLQRRGDMLVTNRSVPAADWKEFIAWVKTQDRPVAIGYIGQYSMAALGFAQALEYENVKYAGAVTVGTVPEGGLSPKPETVRVRLVRVDDQAALAVELEQGRLDAAVLQEPAATLVSAVDGNRTIGRIDILPPGRFEDRPGTIIAATDSVIRGQGEAVGRFLELMAVATHYANNRTRNTLAAADKWLETSPVLESISLDNIAFSSRPDFTFTDGIWNWYFALRLKNAVPESMAGYMEEKDWLGIPYDSLLLMPALDRAGARIIR